MTDNGDPALIPDWCEWGRGDSPILLIAPHGGRRPPVDAAAPPPHLRVNDLYTPEVTRALAERLRAGFIINRGQDRNALDLNRISQVRRHAPWLLELLVREIGHILERHACAELIFVHGWNTGQPKCDIGIGAVETEEGLQLGDGTHLTVSQTYLRTRIAALRAACRQAAIRAPIGERYPASHPNNLLQLFTNRGRAGDHPCVRRIADWVSAGRVEALQLELGIPLRWPGAWRDRFVGAAVAAFTEDSKGTVQSPTWRAPSRDAGPFDCAQGRLRTPHSLQFYDPVSGVGMSAGVGRIGPRVTGGRLLLFLGGQRVALFTGEEPGHHGSGVAPLEYTSDGWQFTGPLLLLDDGATYLDLEAALAASHIVEAEVRVRFVPLHPLPPVEVRSEGRAIGTPQFGQVRGRVRVAARELSVDTGGFVNAGGFRAAASGPQTMIAAAFGTDQALLSRGMHGEGGALALHFTSATTRALDAARISISSDGDPYTPGALTLITAAQPPLYGRPLSRMAILRPLADGRYLRVTFGTAGFRWGEREGYGLYEHAKEVSCNN